LWQLQSANAVPAQCAVAGCAISMQFLQKAVWIMFTCHFRKSAVWQKGANCDHPIKAASVFVLLKVQDILITFYANNLDEKQMNW
jgi:hypothetical protein